jgi:hypothetical protein
MDINTFWDLIHRSKADTCAAHARRLQALLQPLELAEVLDFARHWDQVMIQAYRWDLWAVAFIMMGGCSDDGFEYFRGWLIAQGRAYFEAALHNPEQAAANATGDADEECEDILYVAAIAYEDKTGEALPNLGVVFPAEPAGEEWDEDGLESLYPDLCARFGW